MDSDQQVVDTELSLNTRESTKRRKSGGATPWAYTTVSLQHGEIAQNGESNTAKKAQQNGEISNKTGKEHNTRESIRLLKSGGATSP